MKKYRKYTLEYDIDNKVKGIVILGCDLFTMSTSCVENSTAFEIDCMHFSKFIVLLVK